MSDVCRWGFLSTAEIAQKNWLSVKCAQGARVTAVASRELDKAQDFIERCQALEPIETPPAAFGSYDELLANDQIDAVYIPLPTGIRKDWAVKAAESGKHVLLEKPCGCQLGELQEIVAACRANQVQFMDGVMFMHSQRLSAVREVLDDGQSIGQIRRMTANFTFRAPPEFFTANIRAQAALEPLGCLGDLGWYCIRMIIWTMKRQRPSAVTGRLIQATPDGVPLEFSGELLFADNVTANFYCSFLTEIQQWFDVAGEAGSLRIPDFTLPNSGGPLKFEVSRPKYDMQGCRFEMSNGLQEHFIEEPPYGAAGAQEVRMFERFSSAVNSGQLEPEWAEYSLATQSVMDACFESAQAQGKQISM